MQRTISVIAAAALTAAMLVAVAAPAFADKGGVKGHTTDTGWTGDCETGCTRLTTTSGKEGNGIGGPGHTKSTETRTDSTSGYSDSTTTSGHTEGGGGRSNYESIDTGSGPEPYDITCRGSSAPNPNC